MGSAFTLNTSKFYNFCFRPCVPIDLIIVLWFLFFLSSRTEAYDSDCVKD